MVKIGEALKLSRGDLGGYPQDTIKLIMDMQNDGWRATRSGSSHVVMMAPEGTHRITVSRNKNSAKFLSEDLKRYNAARGIDTKEEKEEVVVRVVTEKHPCPRDSCPRAFNSEEALKVHVDVDHDGMLLCPEEGCRETRETAQKMAIHRTHAHGYVSPRKAQRKKQEADRASRKVLDQVMSDVDKPLTEMEEAVEIANEGIPEGPVKFVNDGVVVVPDDWKPVYDGEGDIVGHSLHAEPNPEDVERVEFLDERDSWVVEDEDLLSTSTVTTLRKVLNAVGLDMEVRVWRK